MSSRTQRAISSLDPAPDAAAADDEHRYRDLVEVASDWIWEMDADLRFSYFSPNYQGASGVSPNAILGKRREEFAHASGEIERWRDHLATLAARQPFRDYTYPLTTADGRRRWMKISGHPLFAEDGAFRGYRGTGKDATAEVELANTLAQSERRLRALVEASSDWLWELDAELRFSYVSPNVEAVTGLSPVKMIGRRRDEMHHIVPNAAAAAAHSATLAARQPFRDYTFSIRRPDGTIGWCKVSGSPVFDQQGAFSGYYGTGTDITAAVEAEARLRESEERFRQLFESASDWFWEADTEGRLTYVSPRHEQVTQNTRNKNIGLRRDEYTDIASNPEGWRAYQAAVAARRPFRDFVWRHLRPDANGRFRWTKTSGVPIIAADGSFAGYRGAASDMTAEIEADQRRRELEAQLHQSQKLESLGQLAGGVAHDINNALVPVLAMAKVVAAKLPDGSRERQCMNIVLSGGMRAKELVQQILAFSRKEDPATREIDLAVVLREAMKMLQATIPSTIRLDIEIAAVPPIIGDANRLGQVVVNLVTNAAQAIGAQPGEITVALRNTPGGERVCLSVADTGLGMDPDVQRRIFEPFFTTKDVGKGTGLGLSVVHGIVTSHGGTIAVESRIGEGSRFEVVLPVAPG